MYISQYYVFIGCAWFNKIWGLHPHQVFYSSQMTEKLSEIREVDGQKVWKLLDVMHEALRALQSFDRAR